MNMDALKARQAELRKALEDVKARAYRIEGALIEVSALIEQNETPVSDEVSADVEPDASKKGK